MVKNKFGRKVIGATLSMVMMASAIPGMTSLASEKAPQSYEATATASTISREKALDNVRAALHLLAPLRDKREAELRAVTDYEYINVWVGIAYDVSFTPDKYTTEEMINISNTLNRTYNSALEALRQAGYIVSLPEIVIDNDPTRFISIIVDNTNDNITLPQIVIDNDDTRFNAFIVEPESSREEAIQNLGAIIDALGSIKTDDNEFESIEVYHHYNSLRHWGVEIYCNTDKFSTDYIVNYTNFLNEIYPAFLASIVTPDAERNAALQNLSDIVDEMIAFKDEFKDELRSIDAYDQYCEWRRLGIEAYCNEDDYSTEYFVELSSILHSVHDAAVEALNPTVDHTLFPQIVIDNDDVRFNAFIVDAETPAEEIAPDYGMTEEIAPDYGMDFEEENVSPLFLQLCDLFDEVYDFEVAFGDEIPMAQRHFLDLEMDRALDVAASAENLSDDEIETMIFELQLAYNTAIDAIDAAPAQAPVQTIEITAEEIAPDYGMTEEIAPDYGMNLDEDTLPEEPAETTDDTLYVIYGEQPEDMDLTGVGLIIQDRCPTNFEETTPDEIIPEERPLVIYGEQPEDMDISTVDLLVQDRCPTI